MTTSTTSDPTRQTHLLADAVQPLVEFLNKRYPTPLDEYYIAPFGQFGQIEQPDNELAIDINLDEHMPELTKRALWTLVRKSGSHFLWNEVEPEIAVESDPYKSPFRIKLIRSCFHMETHDQWIVYLVIDHLGEDFDVEAAECQIALLIGYLDDELNLDELTPAAEAMFAAPSTKIVQDGEEKNPFRSDENN